MFDQNRADYVCQFLELLPFGSGEWLGKPFRLQDWQRDPLQTFYGTLDIDPESSQMLQTYYHNKDKKQVRQYEMQNFLALYKAYKAMKGNSFIEEIYQEVTSWEIIT